MKRIKLIFLCLTLACALCFVGCNDKPAPVPPDPPVEITVKEVTMSKTSAVLVFGGDPLTLTATVKYTDDTTNAKVVWKSSDDKIATVKAGKVTAVGIGSAVITATAEDKDSISAKCAIEVIEKAELTLNASSTVMLLGKGNANLIATVKHQNGTVDSKATFTSSKANVVTVTDAGVLTPKAVGTSVITASATDDGKTLSASCEVKVVADATSLTNGTEKGLTFTLRNADKNDTIGYSVKAQNKEITEAVIPDSFKGARVTEIEEDAFSQCTKITKFAYGKSVVKIGANAFKFVTETELKVTNGREELIHHDRKGEISRLLRTNLTLNAGTVLSEHAFADSFFKVVNIPEGITEIPAYAFQGATITKVNFPTTLTTIKGYAFAGCATLVSADLSHTKIASIGAVGDSDKFSVGNVFLQCGILSTVGTMPATLKTIEPFSFSTCGNLVDVKLNDGLDKIGACAFLHCASIQQLSIPSSVTKVGGNAFGNWGDNQTISVGFKKAEKPAGWVASWMGEKCNAVINYKA